VPNVWEMLQWGADHAWPPWLETVTTCSHLALTAASSATFYIYYAMYEYQAVEQRVVGFWRTPTRILGRQQRSGTPEQTEINLAPINSHPTPSHTSDVD